MKSTFVPTLIIAATLPLLAHAGISDVTPIGKGHYMIGGRGYSTFSSPEKMTAKAMKKANKFCAAQGGKEAVVVSRQAQDAGYDQTTAPQAVVQNNVSATAPVNANTPPDGGMYPVVKQWQPDYQAQASNIQNAFAAMEGYRPATLEILFTCDTPEA